ncbi:hypothetical protein F4808DRAFT_358320 [Astrocystis sublimbata]|nr:hypothetical protein F4808DRAFT_358320 [Astrocystis sublimbata]
MHIVTAFALLHGCLAQATAIPPPTGKYHVGFSKHIIDHYNPNDPLAPNNISTEFLATIYYPTLQTPTDPPRPYLEPELASRAEKLLNHTPGLLSTFTSTIQQDAPFLPLLEEQIFPTLLFGPGGGAPSVAANTILISELVSHGYTVVGLDHPFEQLFIRYPNGTGVAGVDIDFSSMEVLEAIYNTRLIDNAVFLQYFPELTRQIGAPFNTTHIGLFGFSLGGGAALGSTVNIDCDCIVSALNLDGAMWGVPALNSSRADAKKPVFLLGNQNHTNDNIMYDATWQTFPLRQTGYTRIFTVNGTAHLDFSDDAFWKTVSPGSLTGSIDGNRQIKIMNSYVKAFFDFTMLGGDSALLDGPSPEWPEVIKGF